MLTLTAANPEDSAGEHVGLDVRRLGPLERAIRLKRPDDWLEEARSRCSMNVVHPALGECWIWLGNRRQNGYPAMGRLGTQRLAHRVAAWSTVGFEGDLRSYPNVHHICAVKLCINPAHLRFATSITNALEASVRNALIDHITQLRDALAAQNPDHPLLKEALAPDPTAVLPVASTVHSESPRHRARREIDAARYRVERAQNQLRRFEEVLAVEKLVRKGMRQKDALQQLGVSRTTFDSWRRRLYDSFGRE